jgi:hypothetical protein
MKLLIVYNIIHIKKKEHPTTPGSKHDHFAFYSSISVTSFVIIKSQGQQHPSVAVAIIFVASIDLMGLSSL